MTKPGLGIARGDGLHAVGDGRLERRTSAGVGLAQAGLARAEGVLDGRDVRRIRWQEADLAACRCNQLGDSQMRVPAEVVAAYDLSGGVWDVEFRCNALA
jgi:hypothetical protein